MAAPGAAAFGEVESLAAGPSVTGGSACVDRVGDAGSCCAQPIDAVIVAAQINRARIDLRRVSSFMACLQECVLMLIQDSNPCTAMRFLHSRIRCGCVAPSRRDRAHRAISNAPGHASCRTPRSVMSGENGYEMALTCAGDIHSHIRVVHG